VPRLLLAFVDLELASGVFDGKARGLPPETYSPSRSASDASHARALVRAEFPFRAVREARDRIVRSAPTQDPHQIATHRTGERP
jgi:hypothetical protein